ncbi:Uncharacterised protein [Bordetella pertussis]|nr:Uncharacterised protein [Bordetella pertussis]CFL87911.1 Uncharacterised protein [Bordetella pertussis]CFM40525.1 Uncharacterised protein [Bordetella pertussis]CFN04520.1 Uncharacterised protein [Bordetella pertussis]CFN15920.1 Uncharacterised protein [Bordetella pertussis]
MVAHVERGLGGLAQHVRGAVAVGGQGQRPGFEHVLGLVQRRDGARAQHVGRAAAGLELDGAVGEEQREVPFVRLGRLLGALHARAEVQVVQAVGGIVGDGGAEQLVADFLAHQLGEGRCVVGGVQAFVGHATFLAEAGQQRARVDRDQAQAGGGLGHAGHHLGAFGDQFAGGVLGIAMRHQHQLRPQQLGDGVQVFLDLGGGLAAHDGVRQGMLDMGGQAGERGRGLQQLQALAALIGARVVEEDLAQVRADAERFLEAHQLQVQAVELEHLHGADLDHVMGVLGGRGAVAVAKRLVRNEGPQAFGQAQLAAHEADGLDGFLGVVGESVQQPVIQYETTLRLELGHGAGHAARTYC